MAHYAFINSDNIVVEVITGKDESETAPEGFDNWEAYYETKREGLTCKRTSYNTIANVHSNNGTAFRGNYAGIGFIYDATNDVFYNQQPYQSWILNESTWLWEAPISRPDLSEEQINNGLFYMWNEEAYQSDNTTGWDLIQQ